MPERVVCLDPGHGGEDPGAIGVSGTQEKTVNLAVALLARDLLSGMGYLVVMTREDDHSVPLDERAEIAKNAGAHALVSIHHNSASTSGANGTEVFYCRGSGKGLRLAQAVYDRLIALLGTRPRGVSPSALRVPCQAARAGIAACLVEVAFLSNPEEERLAADPDFQARAAQAIAEGVDRFFVRRRP